MEEYLENISNTTIRKNDYILANSYNITTFDPKNLEEITGGILAIIAPTGSGKTVLLKDLLYHIKDQYETIKVFSETAKLQKDYDFIDRDLIIDFFDEKALDEMWEKHRTEILKTKKIKEKTLVILDDIINDQNYKKSKILNDIATGGRHVGLTVILLSQDYNSISPLIRKQIRVAVSFQLTGHDDREKFIKKFLSVENSRVGDVLFRKITDEKYQAIIIMANRVGEPIPNKVFKYTANPNLNPKIKKNNSQNNESMLKVNKKFIKY